MPKVHLVPILRICTIESEPDIIHGLGVAIQIDIATLLKNFVAVLIYLVLVGEPGRQFAYARILQRQ